MLPTKLAPVVLLFGIIMVASVFPVSQPKAAGHLVYAEWFIDTDPGQGGGNAIDPCDGVFDESEEEFCVTDIPAPSLSDGPHTFYLRLQDSYGEWFTRRTDFMLVSSSPYSPRTIAAGEYSIDYGPWNDLPALDGVFDQSLELLLTEDVTSGNLAPGYHTASVRVQDSYGTWSVTRQCPLPIMECNPRKRIVAAEYYIDTDPGAGNGTSMSPGDAAFDECLESAVNSVSSESLTIGMHQVFVRFRDACSFWPSFNGWGPAVSADLEVLFECCGYYTDGYTGNTNCDTEGTRNLDDIMTLIKRVYLTPQDTLCCEANGNVDGDPQGKLTLGDITRLIDHVYLTYKPTAMCP